MPGQRKKVLPFSRIGLIEYPASPSYHVVMEENPYRAPTEANKPAEGREPESRSAEWQQLTVAIFAFGAIGLMLSLTGNEKHLLWLSIMMTVAAVGAALGHWQPKYFPWLHGHAPAFCSFCRKSYKDVGPLVEGPDEVYICRECVRLCDSILDQEEQRRAGGGNGSRPPA